MAAAQNAPNAPTARTMPVRVLPIFAGGCGACMQSVLALQAPRYAAELRARQIAFARSPRHADILLITGPITHGSLDELRRYIEETPEPRALVAVGDCAIDGGDFKGSPDLVASVAEALDVHVEIAGGPPAPSAILAAIVEAAGLLASADATTEDVEPEGDEEAGADAAGAGDEEADA